MALVNESGVKVEGYIYDAYGRHQTFNRSGLEVRFWSTDAFTIQGAGNYGNPYTFTGRRFDPETGLHYYRNRYYDAERGRFISRDPIGIEGGVNLYGYVGNTPYNSVDPLGYSHDWQLNPNGWPGRIGRDIIDGGIGLGRGIGKIGI